MRLRNPGTIDHAIQTIRNLQNYLGNSRGLHDGEARKDAFLNWCEDQARPNLESLLDPGEEILAELESAYHRLALAPQMTLRRLNGMLNREYTIWDQRLRRAEEELQSQKKLAGRPGHPVVLDTSVLMEGEPFLTFGWHALTPALASGPIRLIVPILVVEELDDLLHDPKGDRRQKARSATRELWQLHGARPTDPASLPGQADVTIEVLLDGDWHQRRPNNDAEIIDQALQVYELAGKATLLVSCDYRQLYRAAAVGLPAVLMPRRNQDGAGPTAARLSALAAKAMISASQSPFAPPEKPRSTTFRWRASAGRGKRSVRHMMLRMP
jgi:PIN domain